MARYDLKCNQCKYSFTLEQPMSEDLPSDCPKCNSKDSLQQVYQATPILFHGEGFYCNDSAKSCRGCKK